MKIKELTISASAIILSLIILSAFFLSFHRLDRIPYGFHVDEMSGSIDIGCLSTEGVDAHNVPHPLFSNLNYGTPKPPTFLYPALVWAKFFGYSVPSLRALSVTVHLLGIVGLFFLSSSFFGWRYALLTSTVAILSPWTWNLSRVAFESLYAATFLIWGMFFAFKSGKAMNIILAAVFFSAAMYSYPPFRLQTPLMLLSLWVYSRQKKLWPGRAWTIFMVTMGLLIIPLAQKIISGQIQQRFEGISIFSKQYLNSVHSSGSFMDIIGIFIQNFLLHFNADFLFLKGDPSYVHSTRHFGILGWLDMAALGLALFWGLMLLFKKNRQDDPLILQNHFLLFLLVNILIGVVPAALTNSELPNSLRITGSWPFMCLGSGYFLWQACERWWVSWISICLLSIIFAVVFFNIYFKVFPQEGKGMFSFWALEQANQAKSDEDWLKFVAMYRYQDYNARYYLMQYRGLSCTQARKTWEGMQDYLKAQGIN